MSWNDILNHERPRARFQESVARNRLASTYLFVGPGGIGKRTFALKLAQGLLCSENAADSIDPCGNCAQCQQVAAQTHPDLIYVSRPPGKAFIPLELFIGKPDHRRQSGLCHDIGLKPFHGGRKIAIIDDADFLNIEGANSLLKTLEEPPANSLLILIGSSEQQQLPTIVSRSQIVRFDRLLTDEVLRILNRLGPAELETEIPFEELARVSSGSVELAREQADPDVYEFRRELFRRLATLDPAALQYANEIEAFAKAAGKDSASKRNRLVRVGDFAIEFYQALLAAITGAEGRVSPDEFLHDAVNDIASRWHDNVNDGAEIVACCIESTIRLQYQIRANVSSLNALEIWLRDLGRNCRGQLVESFELD